MGRGLYEPGTSHDWHILHTFHTCFLVSRLHTLELRLISSLFRIESMIRPKDGILVDFRLQKYNM
jgi:hypothetical protein